MAWHTFQVSGEDEHIRNLARRRDQENPVHKHSKQSEAIQKR
jgi:hypothetical protein